MADRAYLERLTKKLADEGKLVEAGWVSLRLAALKPDTPARELDELRMAYMAGAQHVFSSMMAMMDPGTQETDADLRRMDLLHAELQSFYKELQLRLKRTAGNA